MTTIAKAGRYEIVGELGRGAMGVVYKATDPVIGRPVAVKTIKLSEQGTGLTRAELISRFQTEARAAGLLTHHNIVVVYDAGEEDGLFYITMELVEGKSVQALIDAGHAFPLPRILRIMEQACSALQFAHENNIVHRDIKPANIMLTGDDTVKVTDFGTAKILQFGTVQQTAHVMGTPSYMSPEQVKGRAVDGRSDIFSLGVMLYEMITGEKPFPGESITTVIYKIVNEEPVPPRTIDPTIHPGISAAVMRALAKEPEERYQSCRELLEALRNYRSVLVDANPRATVASMGNRNTQPNATVAMNPGLRGLTAENPQVTPGRRLDQYADLLIGSPTQTPPLRRTDHIPPYEQPEEKSIVGTVLAAILMLGVIAFGAYKLKPVLYDMRHPEARSATANSTTPVAAAPTPAATETAPAAADSQPTGNASSQPSNAPAQSDSAQPSAPAPSEAPAGQQPDQGSPATSTPPLQSAVSATPLAAPTKSAPSDAKPDDIVRKKIPPAKIEAVLSPKAAQIKQKIDDALADRGLTGKANVQGIGNALTLTGKLRPADHAALLKLLRDVPAGVHIVDNIGDDDSPASQPTKSNASSAAAPASIATKPAPAAAPKSITQASNDQLTSDNRVAWANVRTFPAGSDIILDGNPTGQSTPARVQLPIGVHTLTLHLDGFKDLLRPVEVSDGGTIEVHGIFRRR
jgi:serine/threonine protein kinase